MADKLIELKGLKLECSSCVSCSLHLKRKNAVFGEGCADSPVVFVGEAPGASEDSHGRPFVGAAGKVFDSALESVGFNRSDVFITNIAKCRPPGNRVPEDGEANICKGKFLLKEISIINPKVVVPLGNTACLHLLGRDGISNLHGKVIEHNGMVYVPCFHPAAVVYNRITLVDLLGALKRVKNICE